MLQEVEEHFQTLQKARPRPHVLDDDTVGRVIEVLGAQADDLWLFEEQLARWQQASPTLAQRQALEHLSGQLTRLRGVLASILAQERGVNLDALAVVQRQADAAWKQMKKVNEQAETAEQDLAETERAHQEAQQHVLATAQRLKAAKQELRPRPTGKRRRRTGSGFPRRSAG